MQPYRVAKKMSCCYFDFYYVGIVEAYEHLDVWRC